LAVALAGSCSSLGWPESSPAAGTSLAPVLLQFMDRSSFQWFQALTNIGMRSLLNSGIQPNEKSKK
jgi:hypothetical protein